MKYISRSQEETVHLGSILSGFLCIGDVVALYGDLGAGKTALVSGLVKGQGFDDSISSPTFTIVNEYMSKIPIFHFDVYRVHDEEELIQIGFEEYFYRDGIVIIEWAEYIQNLLPKELLQIRISKNVQNLELREFELLATGSRYEQLLHEIQSKLGGVYESSRD